MQTKTQMSKYHKQLKENKAITLIALMVTIIVMLILAGVIISQLTGENGLITKAMLTKEITEYKTAKEEVNLKLSEIALKCEIEGIEYNIEEIAKEIEEDEEKTLEKLFNESTGSLKDTDLINLQDIVISVKKYSKYKFLIGQEGEIDGVTTEKITDGTTKEDFYSLEEFETEILVASNNEGNTIKIGVDEITTNSVKVVGKGNLTDYSKFTYIAEQNGTKVQEIKEQTTTSYTIEGLTQGTTYKVYMLAIDNAGNERRSQEKTVTTKTIPEGTREGAITFADPTWPSTNQAKVVIKTNTSYKIQYKKGEDGTWSEPGANGAEVEASGIAHGTILYARLTDGMNYGSEAQCTVADTTPPADFTITVSEVKTTSLKVSGSTTDNQSGIKDYTYVVKQGDTIVKNITGQTATTLEITGLGMGTEYQIYMIAYDKAGKDRQSNTVTITTTVSYDDITWASTPTEITYSGEQFFNIGTIGDKTVLLTKYNLNKSSNAQQNAAYGTTAMAFSTTNYWLGYSGITYPYNLDQTNPPDSATVIKKAIAYGTAKGGIGRLLTYAQANTMKGKGTAWTNVLYGKSYSTGATTNGYLRYWLGSANGAAGVWAVFGGSSNLINYGYGSSNYYRGSPSYTCLFVFNQLANRR